MTIKIFKSKSGWHVTQVASNGKVLNSTEVETSHADVLKNIKSAYNGFGGIKSIRILDFSREQMYWIMKGAKFSPAKPMTTNYRVSNGIKKKK